MYVYRIRRYVLQTFLYNGLGIVNFFPKVYPLRRLYLRDSTLFTNRIQPRSRKKNVPVGLYERKTKEKMKRDITVRSFDIFNVVNFSDKPA